MSDLSGKVIVLGITGGIAAYKACDLTSRLRKAGAQVFVVMTANACEFVQPLTLETLSANPVVTDTFDRPERWEVGHVSLAKKADLIVVAPATANIMAKAACGIADDMLSTTLLAARSPILMAPAMNTAMWLNPATQHNVEILKSRGCLFIGPEGGFLACGDEGPGRMSEPSAIVEAIRKAFCRQDLKGIRIAVTAGPTREMLDPVRFITNRSSGKMGYAIAEAASGRGAEVTLISGPVSLACPPDVTRIDVVSTEQLAQAVRHESALCDILIQSAAPCDFAPEQAAPQKIKKDGSGVLNLRLVETPDIAAECGRSKREDQVFVGFAAETENFLQSAQKKLIAKNLDMIALNDVSRTDIGFDSEDNQLTLISRQETVQLPKLTKSQCADELLDRAALLLRKKRSGAV